MKIFTANSGRVRILHADNSYKTFVHTNPATTTTFVYKFKPAENIGGILQL